MSTDTSAVRPEALVDDGLCSCFGKTWSLGAGRYASRGVPHCCLCHRPRIACPSGPHLRFARARWFTAEELAQTRLLKSGHVALVWVNAVDLDLLVKAGIAVNQTR